MDGGILQYMKIEMYEHNVHYVIYIFFFCELVIDRHHSISDAESRLAAHETPVLRGIIIWEP
jgi:hypothetical protein